MLWNKLEDINHQLIANPDKEKDNHPVWFPAIALFILGVVMRLPFQTQIATGDEINFALAVEHFDVRLEQPQMPGMFIIFIFLARFFNVFLKDPTASLVMVNVITAGLTAAVLYIMATRWFNPRVGWTAALLTLTSPALWFYSETAFSHTLEFFWVVLINYAAYCTGLGDRKALFGLGILMGLAGGIRPSTPFFLLPAALVATGLGLRTRKFSLGHVIAAVLVGFLVIALWLIPLVMLSGGPQAYGELLQGWLPLHTERQDADSFVKVFDNLMVILKAFIQVVGIAMIPMLWFLVRNRAALQHGLRRDWRVQTFFLSIVPGIMYFLLVHLRRKSQALTIMPAVVVMAALTLVWLSDRLVKKNRYAWMMLTAGIVSLNGLYFLVGPLSNPTAREILSINRDLVERIEYVKTHFPADTTAVWTRDYYSRLPELYLRDYQNPRRLARLPGGAFAIPPQVQTLVLLDDRVFTDPGQDADFQDKVMPSGNTIRYLTWSPQQRLQLFNASAKLVPRAKKQ